MCPLPSEQVILLLLSTYSTFSPGVRLLSLSFISASILLHISQVVTPTAVKNQGAKGLINLTEPLCQEHGQIVIRVILEELIVSVRFVALSWPLALPPLVRSASRSWHVFGL